MTALRLAVLSFFLVFLVLIGGCLLWVPFHMQVENFELAHAVVEEHTNPSERSSAVLEKADRSAFRERIVVFGIAWGLIILDAYAIFKIVSQMRNSSRNL
jgi:hypothetical protein